MRSSTRVRMLALTVALVAASTATGVAAPAGARPSVAQGPSVTDGRISFVVDTRACDDCHLVTVEPDGGDRMKLTDRAAGGAGWSPDGTRLVFPTFVDDGRVGTGVIGADGSGFEAFEIPDPTLNLACWNWSPDGARLSCEGWDETQRGREGIYLVDSSDGQNLERLTTNPYDGPDFVGDFSPDGTRYAFVRENAQRRRGHTAVFVVNLDGTGLDRITRWRIGAESVSWSADGERLVVGLIGGTLATMAPDGSDLTRIDLRTGAGFAYATHPSWSPDGTRVVFAMYLARLRQIDIFTAEIDGTHVTQLTDTRRNEGFPDWGPATP